MGLVWHPQVVMEKDVEVEVVKLGANMYHILFRTYYTKE